jgi:hypothetical protein
MSPPGSCAVQFTRASSWRNRDWNAQKPSNDGRKLDSFRKKTTDPSAVPQDKDGLIVDGQLLGYQKFTEYVCGSE